MTLSARSMSRSPVNAYFMMLPPLNWISSWTPKTSENNAGEDDADGQSEKDLSLFIKTIHQAITFFPPYNHGLRSALYWLSEPIMALEIEKPAMSTPISVLKMTPKSSE